MSQAKDHSILLRFSRSPAPHRGSGHRSRVRPPPEYGKDGSSDVLFVPQHQRIGRPVNRFLSTESGGEGLWIITFFAARRGLYHCRRRRDERGSRVRLWVEVLVNVILCQQPAAMTEGTKRKSSYHYKYILTYNLGIGVDVSGPERPNACAI